MFLKSLTIEANGRIIREITFKKGLNLIVDESPSDDVREIDKKESGNNVGKTTVLRLVDFCLNGDGKNIYTDTEFKEKHNTIVENYLVDNNVIITTVLKQDLDDDLSEEVVINRNFLKRSQKIFNVNGEKYKNAEYDSVLKKLILETNVDKPTFRQIISRNIRDEKNKLVNTIQVLHQTTTMEEYEALFFFWFGIETDAVGRKQKLQEQKKAEEKFLARLKKELSEAEIQQALVIINRDIIELLLQKDSFIIDEKYEAWVGELREIKTAINSVTSEIGRLSIRYDIIEESKRELEQGFASNDNEVLKEIYNTAGMFIPEMHKRFEELVDFHNKMQNEKIKFVTDELPSLVNVISNKRKSLKSLIKQERELSDKIRNSNVNDDYETIVSNLNRKYEQKGNYEIQEKQIVQSREKIGSIKKEIENINNGLISKDEQFAKQIEEFNKYFSTISEALYGEKFILYADKNERAYQLKISSIDGNLGTGKKKGQIAAFDLAYILYCDNNDIQCLHFVMQDQTENIHDNQIRTLAEITSMMNVQYITPVLRDKVPSDINIDEFSILVLSQNDKLFRV